MVQPEIRDIRSVDLQPPDLPADPLDCEIRLQAVVGPRRSDGDGDDDETFQFLVVTPTRLDKSSDPQWGHGKLIVPVFEWQAIAHAVALLLARCVRPTWEQCVAELSKALVRDVQPRGTPPS